MQALYARNQSVREQLSETALALERAQGNENTFKVRGARGEPAVLTEQFKTRSLEQELELARKDVAWSRDELARAHEAAAATRVELHARVSHAETELDVTSRARFSAASQLSKVEAALAEAQAKHMEAAARAAELSAELTAKEHDFRLQRDALERSVELAEGRTQHAEARAAELEATCDAVMEQCRAREADAEAEAAVERAANAQVREENAALQEALDRLAGSLGIAVGERGALDAAGSTPSHAARYAQQVHREGKSFSDVYLDLVRAQEELRRERLETGRLQGVLAEVVADLDAHAPQLRAQREENEQLREELDQLTAELSQASEDRDSALAATDDAHAQLEAARRDTALLTQQLDDASAQVRTLMRELLLQRDPSAAERLEEDDAEQEPPANIHEVISEELVTFKSVSYTHLTLPTKRIV